MLFHEFRVVGNISLKERVLRFGFTSTVTANHSLPDAISLILVAVAILDRHF